MRSIHPSIVYSIISISCCQIIDLKGTPRADQNDLLDFFVTITSTKPELEQTSFLTELDMEPSTTSALALTAPNSSRVASPGVGAGEALFPTLPSPPLSHTPSASATPPPRDTNPSNQAFPD